MKLCFRVLLREDAKLVLLSAVKSDVGKKKYEWGSHWWWGPRPFGHIDKKLGAH